MSLVTLVARLTTVSTIAPTIAAMVGIGVGIDYALLLVVAPPPGAARRRRRAHAIARANATAGRSVVFAGVHGARRHLRPGALGRAELRDDGRRHRDRRRRRDAGRGHAAARAARPRRARACSAAARAGACRPAPGARRAASRSPAAGPPAPRAGPSLFAVASLAALLALCAPVLDMRLGQSDAGSEPTSAAHPPRVRPGRGRLRSRRQRPAARRRRPARRRVDAAALRATLADAPASPASSRPCYDAAARVALLTVVPSTRSAGRRDRRPGPALRDDVLPDGVRVTGATAAFMDFNQRLQDRLPLVVGAVVLSSSAAAGPGLPVGGGARSRPR